MIADEALRRYYFDATFHAQCHRVFLVLGVEPNSRDALLIVRAIHVHEEGEQDAAVATTEA